MKSGRAKIGIFQNMRIKNLRGSVRSVLKKLESFTLETSKNHLVRNFLRNGRLSVKIPEISGFPDLAQIKYPDVESSGSKLGICQPSLVFNVKITDY